MVNTKRRLLKKISEPMSYYKNLFERANQLYFFELPILV